MQRPAVCADYFSAYYNLAIITVQGNARSYRVPDCLVLDGVGGCKLRHAIAKTLESNFDQITDMLRPPTSVRHEKFGPSLTAAEGFVLGTAVKMFTIAGPVIAFGLSASVVYGLILCLLQ